MKNRRRRSGNGRSQDIPPENPAAKSPGAVPAATEDWQPHWSIRLLAVLLMAGLPLVAAHLFFVPFYQTNDDIGNDAALRGILVSETPSHLTHCHPWFGRFVQLAYNWFPDWPCYRITCLAIHLAGSVGLFSALLRSGVSLWRLGLCAAYASIFDFPAYVWPQFTVTAGQTAAAGIVICLFASRFEGSRFLWWLTGLLVVFAAGCVRASGLQMAIALFFPAIAMATLAEVVGSWRRGAGIPLKRLAGDWNVVIAAVMVFGFLQIGARLDTPQTDEYKDFLRFQKARWQILDFGRYPDGDNLEEVLRETGLSKNDLGMFLLWCICDEKVYSAERLEAIVAASPVVRPDYLAVVQEIARQMSGDRQFRALAILLVCVLLLCFRSPKDVLSVVTVALTMLVLCVVLAAAFHLPHRVRVALMAGTLAFTFQLQNGWRMPQPPRAMGAIVVALMLVATVLAANVVQTYAVTVKERARQSANALGLMEKVLAIPDAKVIVVGAQFPFELIPAGRDLRDFKSWPIIWLGSDGVHGAGVKSRMKRLGVEHVMKQLATDSNTFVFVHQDFFPIFSQWVLEHFGLHRQCEPIGFVHQDDAGMPVHVWGMLPIEEEDGPPSTDGAAAHGPDQK